MKKWKTYYSKVSKRVQDCAIKLQKLLETNNYDVDGIMREFFGKYWKEFSEFWKQSGETIDWISFACAPHNGVMFMQYVMNEYPEVLEQVEKDLCEIESSKLE